MYNIGGDSRILEGIIIDYWKGYKKNIGRDNSRILEGIIEEFWRDNRIILEGMIEEYWRG